MEIEIEILKKQLAYLNDQIHIYTQQYQPDIVEYLLVELHDIEQQIQSYNTHNM